jgi:hypothetical protein
MLALLVSEKVASASALPAFRAREVASVAPGAVVEGPDG